MHPALNVHQLGVVRKNKKILQNINFEVKKGEIIGLFGPSGSGKTTLMRSIIGLQRISEGSIHILGHRRGTLRARSLIGYMSQNQGYYIDLSAKQNLEYFRKIVGAPKSQVNDLLKELRLDKFSHNLAGDMSGGQQARISLATALLGHPELVILDEPTGGLDPILRRELWHYFKNLSRGGMTFLISSHDLSEAEYCDRVILIRDGLLLADDHPGRLIEKTKASDMEDVFVKLVKENDES